MVNETRLGGNAVSEVAERVPFEGRAEVQERFESQKSDQEQ
jgi:hypothetical protein